MSRPASQRPNFIVFVVIVLLVGTWLNRHEILGLFSEPQTPDSLDLQHSVVMYSTSWCPYCVKARDWLDKRGVDFVEYDIEKSPEAAAQYRRLRGRGTPLLVIGDDVIQGYSPARMDLAVRVLEEVDRGQ